VQSYASNLIDQRLNIKHMIRHTRLPLYALILCTSCKKYMKKTFIENEFVMPFTCEKSSHLKNCTDRYYPYIASKPNVGVLII
jgi:hypothetical protein